jgi:hypothetical protein
MRVEQSSAQPIGICDISDLYFVVLAVDQKHMTEVSCSLALLLSISQFKSFPALDTFLLI